MDNLGDWGPWFAGASLFVSTATLMWSARKLRIDQDTAAVAMAKDAVDIFKEVAEERDKANLDEIASLRGSLRQMIEHCEEEHDHTQK